MLRARFATILALSFLLAGCSSEDPRLPGNLYEEARKLNLEGRSLEARAMMQQLVARYPDTDAARQARRDLYLLDAFVARDIADRHRQMRSSMNRICDALSRYKGKHGEYPGSLQDLVPEYLDQVPETPWGHPFLYRAYVSQPIEDVQPRRGPVRQRFNTKLDTYDLACLGTDLKPGGEGDASDTLLQNGKPVDGNTFPPIPQPQPLR